MAEKRAREVAKKQAVERALRESHSRKGGEKAKAAPKPAPVLGAKKTSFDSLLSQIEAEKQRIEAQKAAAPTARGAKKDGARDAAAEACE